jgi:hypothetical protein
MMSANRQRYVEWRGTPFVPINVRVRLWFRRNVNQSGPDRGRFAFDEPVACTAQQECDDESGAGKNKPTRPRVGQRSIRPLDLYGQRELPSFSGAPSLCLLDPGRVRFDAKKGALNGRYMGANRTAKWALNVQRPLNGVPRGPPRWR